MGIIGIDIDKKELKCYVLRDSKGRKTKFQNNIQGLKKLEEEIQDDTVVIEATATYSTRLASWLKIRGHKVLLISPNVLARNKDPRKKSDYNDAEKLANMASEGKPIELNNLKELVSYLEFLDGEIIRYKNRFKRTIIMVDDDDKITKKRLREIVEGKYEYNEEYLKLQYAEAVIYELRGIARQLLELEDMKRELLKRIEEVVPKDHVIFTIPGIGLITAAVILARVGDFSRFKKAEKFVAYCGLDPVTERSGTRIVSHGISKRGDKYLRKMFYLAVLGILLHRNNPVIVKYYDERKDKVPHKKLVVACTRKLARIVWSVCYHNKPFDPNA
ncbi:IS110 family transposase [Sulfolobus tengchongensis]|uniref:IS110 family transposase n=1 Tax=Sulfolobus tengchongensis TaxID=207809 RepID=A0AAX4L2F1_9CREN